MAEAGASLAGGHSVEDDEPKYGLAVTGIVSPKGVITNAGAKPGDLLILTKPLGTGVLFNACRSGKLPLRDLEPILPQVAALNRTAMEIALKFEVHSCTDITGFGILGHALEMATASSVRIELEFSALPSYPNSVDMYRKGETTGSNKANRKLVEDSLAYLCPALRGAASMAFRSSDIRRPAPIRSGTPGRNHCQRTQGSRSKFCLRDRKGRKQQSSGDQTGLAAPGASEGVQCMGAIRGVHEPASRDQLLLGPVGNAPGRVSYLSRRALCPISFEWGIRKPLRPIE